MNAHLVRPYQAQALEAISGGLEQGLNRLLMKQPTGCGKTYTFAQFLKWPRIASWLGTLPPGRGARMLVIAHREELLAQARATIERENPGLMVMIEQADSYASRFADVIVASIQTLSARKFARLLRLIALHDFRIVVVDECHHAAAASYRTALVHLGFLPPADASESGEIEAATHDDVEVMTKALEGWDQIAPKDRLLVGVTATPNRTDAIGLGCVFQSIAYSYALKQAVEDGWLVPIVPWVIETAESLDEVRLNRGDFNQGQLAQAVNTPARNRLAVEGWRRYANGLSTLAFTVDVQHAHDLADAFSRDGVTAAALSGKTPTDERRQMLADYTAGKIQVITNCMVLTEGTDLPRTGCILHAKPTKSPTLYEQMTGRGLRTHPGKDACIVIDLVDVARKHSLQTAPVLYGLPPGLNTKGKDLRQAEAALEKLREANPNFDVDAALANARMSLEDLQVRASTFDVWTVPQLGAFGAGRAFEWIKYGADTYRLQYPWADGNEVLTVQRDLLGKFELSLTLRPNGGGQVRQKTIAQQVDTAEAAAAIAETFVLQERRSVMKLADRDAPWRQRPASEKQLGLLRRLRVPIKPKLTMGEASNLINLAKARMGR